MDNGMAEITVNSESWNLHNIGIVAINQFNLLIEQQIVFALMSEPAYIETIPSATSVKTT